MSRDKKKYPEFDKALVMIGNQEYAVGHRALSTIQNPPKVLRDFIKATENNPEQLAILNTFTYGSRGSKERSQFTQADYVKARRGTTEAERKLAPESDNPEAEMFFLTQNNHTPKNLSEIYTDQALATSVFATPRGGTHRIDKYDGSITVSEHIFPGSMSDGQKNRIITDHKKSIEKQLTVLNTFLQPLNIVVSSEEYIAMLKTGNMPPVLMDKKVNFLKKPQFFEARAMVNGNICANKADGIAFPTFTYDAVTPGGIKRHAVQ